MDLQLIDEMQIRAERENEEEPQLIYSDTDDEIDENQAFQIETRELIILLLYEKIELRKTF